MKDKKSLRLLSIGFFSGIIISGVIFLSINFFTSPQVQQIRLESSPVMVQQVTQINSFALTNKLDLNKATVSDLVSLPGIGETKANAIIDFRAKYGDFEEISELSYVPGIGTSLLKSIQDLVIIN